MLTEQNTLCLAVRSALVDSAELSAAVPPGCRRNMHVMLTVPPFAKRPVEYKSIESAMVTQGRHPDTIGNREGAEETMPLR